jgi:hypothetical protein
MKILESITQLAPSLMNVSNVLHRAYDILVVSTEGSTLQSQCLAVEKHGIVVVSNLQMDPRNVVKNDSNIAVVRSKKSSSDAQAFEEILHDKLVQFHLE